MAGYEDFGSFLTQMGANIADRRARKQEIERQAELLEKQRQADFERQLESTRQQGIESRRTNRQRLEDETIAANTQRMLDYAYSKTSQPRTPKEESQLLKQRENALSLFNAPDEITALNEATGVITWVKNKMRGVDPSKAVSSAAAKVIEGLYPDKPDVVKKKITAYENGQLPPDEMEVISQAAKQQVAQDYDLNYNQMQALDRANSIISVVSQLWPSTAMKFFQGREDQVVGPITDDPEVPEVPDTAGAGTETLTPGAWDQARQNVKNFPTEPYDTTGKDEYLLHRVFGSPLLKDRTASYTPEGPSGFLNQMDTSGLMSGSGVNTGRGMILS